MTFLKWNLLIVFFASLQLCAEVNANTIINYTAASDVNQLAVVAVSYCAKGQRAWTACNGGTFMTIPLNGQLNVESACVNGAIGAYQVTVADAAQAIQTCLRVNGTGVIAQLGPDEPQILSGDFLGDGNDCGTPCG